MYKFISPFTNLLNFLSFSIYPDKNMSTKIKYYIDT